jgi:hypothetical protein
MMKRLLMGVVWFLALWLGTRILGGAVVGALAGRDSGTFDTGYQAGNQASHLFNQRYGIWIFLAAFLVAAIGTLQGWLPGTGKRRA